MYYFKLKTISQNFYLKNIIAMWAKNSKKIAMIKNRISISAILISLLWLNIYVNKKCVFAMNQNGKKHEKLLPTKLNIYEFNGK